MGKSARQQAKAVQNDKSRSLVDMGMLGKETSWSKGPGQRTVQYSMPNSRSRRLSFVLGKRAEMNGQIYEDHEMIYDSDLELSHMIQFLWDAIKRTQNEWLKTIDLKKKNQTFNISQSWKLQVQSQDVNRAVLSLKVLGKNIVLTSSLHHSQK